MHKRSIVRLTEEERENCRDAIHRLKKGKAPASRCTRTVRHAGWPNRQPRTELHSNGT